jgi:hypothetical protein
LYVYKPAELDDFREIFVNISRDIRDIRDIVVVLPYSCDQNRKQICTDIINSNINRQDAEGMKSQGTRLEILNTCSREKGNSITTRLDSCERKNKNSPPQSPHKEK